MKIFDQENLIPDHALLINVISSHPFDRQLVSKIARIDIVLSEWNCIPLENINTDVLKGEVRLGVGRSTHIKRDYISILYHEFGHVADRMNVDFQYSERMKSELVQAKQICLMEIWNIFINSRLNAENLYTTSGIECRGTLNGKREIFPGTVDGDLKVHMATLEREGFPYKFAKELVEEIWNNPKMPLTYPLMIEKTNNCLAK